MTEEEDGQEGCGMMLPSGHGMTLHSNSQQLGLSTQGGIKPGKALTQVGQRTSEELVAIGSYWERKYQSSLKDVAAQRIPYIFGKNI